MRSLSLRRFGCLLTILFAASCSGTGSSRDPLPSLPLKDKAVRSPEEPPPAPREFRAAWVATVGNIDWPSTSTLSTEEQQKEIIEILDRSVELNLNCIVLQVRTSCDALYESKLEPWSSFLTGKQGKAPEPYYDPLKMWVEESHKRGIELHAWFNPFRARPGSGSKDGLSKDHIANTHPDWVKKYGNMLWLDPGEPGAQDLTYEVFMDVVKRYDVDGIHIDDYFYPYPVMKNPDNKEDKTELPFPDDESYGRYQKSGGKLSRDDWRRKNISDMMKRIYEGTKREKSWVKFGISPFGIPRPQLPGIEYVKGFDQYAKLYADAVLFLQEGWCDYLAPQLYWREGSMNQSYLGLLQWWTHNNPKGRNIYPGLFTSRIDWSEASWGPWDILGQIQTTRLVPGGGGHVHFSMMALTQNRRGISDLLRANHYAESALVPMSPWLDTSSPPAPSGVDTSRIPGAAKKPATTTASSPDRPTRGFRSRRPRGESSTTGSATTQAATRPFASLSTRPAVDPTLGQTRIMWTSPGKSDEIFQWAVYYKQGESWHFKVVPANVNEVIVRDDGTDGATTMVAVASVNRNGNESDRVIIKTPQWKPPKKKE